MVRPFFVSDDEKTLLGLLVHHPIFWFACLSIVALGAFGLGISYHYIYNLEALYNLEHTIANENFSRKFANSPWSLTYYYIKYLSPLLEFGAIFIAFSLLVKLFSFYIVYHTANHLIKNSLASILTSSIFIFAPYYQSHGVVSNGLWSRFAFFPGTLSVLVALSGFLFFLRRNYIVAGLLLAISIQIHPLHGLTTTIWLSLGALVMIQKHWTPNQTLPVILAASLVVFSLIYTVLFTDFQGQITESTASVSSWFRFIESVQPDDLLFSWALGYTGYLLIPILATGLFLSLNQSIKDAIDYYVITTSALAGIIFVVELFHRNGIFFGSFSEYVIAAQLHRGFWIGILFALLSIVRNLSDLQYSTFSKYSSELVVFGVSIYLVPNLFGLILLLLLCVVFFRTKFSLFIVIIACVFGYFYFSHDHLEISGELRRLLRVLLPVFLYFILIRVFSITKTLNTGWYSSEIAYSIGFAALIFLLLGLSQDRIRNDVAALTTGGIFQKTERLIFTEHVHRTYKNKLDRSLRACLKNEMERGDAQEYLAQFPFSDLEKGEQNYYGTRYLYSRVDYSGPLYSKLVYQQALRKLNILFGSNNVEEFFQMGEAYDGAKMLKYFDGLHHSQLEDQLLRLYGDYGLDIYVIDSERKDLSRILICQGDSLWAYDLSKL